MGGKEQAPAVLSPERDRYPFYRRPSGWAAAVLINTDVLYGVQSALKH